jgi:GT2 family glycosyltransferase
VRTNLVSVVIVAGGLKGNLESCLDSLRRQAYKPQEIVVIDNSLNRDFSQEIAAGYPEVKLYPQPVNLFYAAGLNKGIDLSRGEFILCLNDDTVLDKQFIQKALNGFSRQPAIGMVSGKILRREGAVIDSAGLFLTPWRTAQERGYGRKDNRQYNFPGYIFGVSGAAAFYRRKMLEELSIAGEYFDSDFRMFYEDLDIAWRAQRRGWKAYYLPQAIAFHLRGGTARQGLGIDKPYARRYLNDDLYLDLIKNRYLSIIKNESVLGFLFHLPFILCYDFLTYACILFSRPRLFKRLTLNFKYLKSALKKRIINHKRSE